MFQTPSQYSLIVCLTNLSHDPSTTEPLSAPQSSVFFLNTVALRNLFRYIKLQSSWALSWNYNFTFAMASPRRPIRLMSWTRSLILWACKHSRQTHRYFRAPYFGVTRIVPRRKIRPSCSREGYRLSYFANFLEPQWQHHYSGFCCVEQSSRLSVYLKCHYTTAF